MEQEAAAVSLHDLERMPDEPEHRLAEAGRSPVEQLSELQIEEEARSASYHSFLAASEESY